MIIRSLSRRSGKRKRKSLPLIIFICLNRGNAKAIKYSLFLHLNVCVCVCKKQKGSFFHSAVDCECWTLIFLARYIYLISSPYVTMCACVLASFSLRTLTHSLTHIYLYSIALNPEASFVALLRSRLVDCILWGIFHVLLAYLKRERKPISIFIASRVDMPYKLVYRIPIHCVVLLLTIKKYIYTYINISEWASWSSNGM